MQSVSNGIYEVSRRISKKIREKIRCIHKFTEFCCEYFLRGVFSHISRDSQKDHARSTEFCCRDKFLHAVIFTDYLSEYTSDDWRKIIYFWAVEFLLSFTFVFVQNFWVTCFCTHNYRMLNRFWKQIWNVCTCTNV